MVKKAVFLMTILWINFFQKSIEAANSYEDSLGLQFDDHVKKIDTKKSSLQGLIKKIL